MSVKPLTLLLVIGLAACRPADDGLALQADYLQRLSNAAESSAAADFDRKRLLRYRLPPRRERVGEIPEIRIGLLDLLIDVRRCPDLQQQISLRNSSLGKQLVPSSRLAYEGDLLRAIDACLAHLQNAEEHALQATLSNLATAKRTQLLPVFWNALNASPEVERYLRFAERALPTAPAEDQAALDALAQLSALGHSLPDALPPPAAQLDPLFFAGRSAHWVSQQRAGAFCRTSSSSITRAVCSLIWLRYINAAWPGATACASSARSRRFHR